MPHHFHIDSSSPNVSVRWTVVWTVLHVHVILIQYQAGTVMCNHMDIKHFLYTSTQETLCILLVILYYLDSRCHPFPLTPPALKELGWRRETNIIRVYLFADVPI